MVATNFRRGRTSCRTHTSVKVIRNITLKASKHTVEIAQYDFCLLIAVVRETCGASFSDKPSEPQNLQVTEITKESVGLRWEPPESTGGMDITQYVVEKRDTTRGGNWVQAATVDGRTTKHVVGKLIEGNEYLLRVAAENKIGTGPPAELSQPVTAKLPYGTLSSRSSSLIYNTIQYILFQATRPISSKTNTHTRTHTHQNSKTKLS